MVQVVPFRHAANVQDVEKAHNAYVEDGYEGCMVRSYDAPYDIGKRSHALLKLKAFVTDEFPIVGIEEAQGADRGTAIFVCRTANGMTFNVRMKATRAERAVIWQQHVAAPQHFMEKLLTVQYQELTAAQIPRFPVGLAIRDYE